MDIKSLLKDYDYYLSDAVYNNGSYTEKEIEELWNKIKENKEVLKEAIKVRKNKWQEDILTSRVICMFILVKKDVDEDIYMNLVSTICTNKQISRQEIYDDKFLFGDSTYLEFVLGDCDIKLTKEQKKFAEKEASERKDFLLSGYILENPNWQDEERTEFLEERNRVRIKKMRNC